MIHATALVAQGAVIGKGTTIGPYSIIGPNVVIGNSNQIGPHVVIQGNTLLGDENRIFQFASIGSEPQDTKWQGDLTSLVIGNQNTIREYVTIQPATYKTGKTLIGDHNLFMTSSHIAHDVVVGSHCWFASYAGIAGHAIIDDHVIVGGLAGVHQHVRIGRYAFVSAGSIVTNDVPPFSLVQGDRAKLVHINKTGLVRHGFNHNEIKSIHKAFITLFRDPELASINLARKMLEHSSMFDCAFLQEISQFIVDSTRGVVQIDVKTPETITN